jgi:DNA polymerase family A
MNTYAIDFETYYSKTCSVTEQGVYHYLRHLESDIYLVSIAGTDGTKFVGHPKDAPWATVCSSEPTWISHNTGFDMPVFMRLQELGQAPEYLKLTAWHDTADLAAFLGYPRSLKEASFYLLGKEISKDTRDKMRGQRWEEMLPEFREETLQYALTDAENCLQIWLEHSHKWPEHERSISKMTREMAYVGVPLCRETIEDAIHKLGVEVWKAEALVPWAQEQPVLSPLAVQAECARVGIEFPGSLAQGDPEVDAWEEKYSDKYPWIKAIRNYRKANKHLKTAQTMGGRLRTEGPYEGFMAYGLKYFGAHTGRDSGDSGWNAQNLPKGKLFDVDLRSCIKAPADHTLLIVDLSQIEPRVLHWLAGDTTMLRYIRECPDLYEAQARAWGLYSKPGSLKTTDPKLRHQIKQLALGLGYGMGAKKFQTVAGVSADEADRLVRLYRSKNPLVTQLWKSLEDNLRKTAKSHGDHHAEVSLPSGRTITYRNVSTDHGGLTAEIPRNGKMLRLGMWGGTLTENLVQAVARDVFMDRCVDLYNANLKCCLRVHDEAVIVVPKATADRDFKQAIQIMTTPPDWATGLPLAAEGMISDTYTK